MKIKNIRIENFRGFQDETIVLNQYSCFVGPNGAGKSTVLAALNVFFQEKASSTTDVSKLKDEDYFSRSTSTPIRITVVFEDLGELAGRELAEFVQSDELVVTAEAIFDATTNVGVVKHYGQRPGIDRFDVFFDAVKASAKAIELNSIYDTLRAEFPELAVAGSKDAKSQSLREYEASHHNLCNLVLTPTDFCGPNNTGKLTRFVQWVYVPAVKDAADEGEEAKNTALGKLIARAVRSRTSFEADLEALRNETLTKYRQLLDKNQQNLNALSQSLQNRLESWAHPGARLEMDWLSDPTKSVVVQSPLVGIKTGEGAFLGNLARMGHGLQRSYLLALLQELASSELENAPTLILGCEEPELYQHPPQAKHLADVLCTLANGNNQILVTTHSPLFVSGEGFENIRLVRRTSPNGGSTVSSLSYERLCARIRTSLGDATATSVDGLVAKIHQALQPGIAEKFFSRIPVLVEGLEDVSYITTQLHLSDMWTDFRRLGCHLIPVNGKDKLIQPLAITIELKMPVFVVFDADGDTQRQDHRIKHERDNKALLQLLGQSTGDTFPTVNVFGSNYAIWPTNLGTVVKADFNEHYERMLNSARRNYAHEGGLEKNDLFIADWLSAAWKDGHKSPTLERLCESIIAFAKTA